MRDVPGECFHTTFPNGRASITTFANGAKTGHGNALHERLRQWVRVSQNREPSQKEAILDSQTVETASMISQEVGYDSGKKIKGRKRHVLVDTLGLVMVVVVTAASVSEQAGAKQVLSKLNQVRDCAQRSALWAIAFIVWPKFGLTEDTVVRISCTGLLTCIAGF